VASHEQDGSFARDIALTEHAGTHVDAPSHFAPAGRHVDELEPSTLVRPAVRLDVRELVGDDGDFELPASALEAIEARDGVVPPGSVALVHTGWDRYLLDPARYGATSTSSFPGIGGDAARLLVERGVAGIGIDTLGIDPGRSTLYDAHHVTLPAGVWHVEGLVGLERLPARGAWIVVAPIPLVGGSGAPARVFALLP
jgi:kynurenine formamidase